MKISEINVETLTNEQCTKLIFTGIDYTGEKAATGLLLGTNADAEGRAIGAAALYKDGGFQFLIPTGGPEWDFPDGKLSEAEYQKLVAVREGVPSDKVFCENQAQDTYQNMTYSLEIMQAHAEMLEGDTVIVITSAYHMKRSMMLAQHVFPEKKIVPYPIYEEEVKPENWTNSERGIRRVKSEIFFLSRHAVRGIVEDAEIEL